MTRGVPSLLLEIQAALPAGSSGIVIGLSGGTDSTALLALLTRAPRLLPLRAVHINHGLQAAAADFQGACRQLCERLGVPLDIITVNVSTAAGVSLEATARDARYAALRRELRSGECLLTAHHQEDQAETVLLQLLRGAGLKGLSAMPTCRTFGAGWHVRPLLHVARAELLEAARSLDIAGVVDPMNADLRFDRAYLRHQVWPFLAARWPGAATALSRAAAHSASAHSLLDESAARHWCRVRDGAQLSVAGLRALHVEDRLNVVRYWLVTAGVQMPSTARLVEALRQILNARPDQSPRVTWGDCALRRYRDRLFISAAQVPSLPDTQRWSCALDATLELGAGLGSLEWRPRRGGLDANRLPTELDVRRRRGGELLKPARHARTQSLQHLCQVMGVLPWMRQALPLIFADDALIAVGDLWTDARWCVGAQEVGQGVAWVAAPTVL